MINTILIGELIYDTLDNSSELSSYVGERIWPLVAPYTKPEDVIYPFIVYSKTNISSYTLDKDGWYNDTVDFQIVVESEKYLESIEIANIIRQLFEEQRVIDEGLNIILDEVKMTNISENFTDDTFIQTLFFRGYVENYE